MFCLLNKWDFVIFISVLFIVGLALYFLGCSLIDCQYNWPSKCCSFECTLILFLHFMGCRVLRLAANVIGLRKVTCSRVHSFLFFTFKNELVLPCWGDTRADFVLGCSDGRSYNDAFSQMFLCGERI